MLLQLSRSCGPKSWGREDVQASSPVGLIFLGGPISAGWNKIAAARVQTSDKASSLPMLDVPGRSVCKIPKMLFF
jgi:hypothetical protein